MKYLLITKVVLLKDTYYTGLCKLILHVAKLCCFFFNLAMEIVRFFVWLVGWFFLQLSFLAALETEIGKDTKVSILDHKHEKKLRKHGALTYP